MRSEEGEEMKRRGDGELEREDKMLGRMMRRGKSQDKDVVVGRNTKTFLTKMSGILYRNIIHFKRGKNVLSCNTVLPHVGLNAPP